MFTNTADYYYLGYTKEDIDLIKFDIDRPAAGLDLSRITWEYWDVTTETWKLGSVISDSTNGLTQDGVIEFNIDISVRGQRTITGAPGEYDIQLNSIFRWDGAAWQSAGANFWPYGSTQGYTLLSDADDSIYFGFKSPFEGMKVHIKTLSSGLDNLIWEYWDGSAWKSLAVSDGSNRFSQTRSVLTWTVPSDWRPTTPEHNTLKPSDTKLYYYIRARTTDASFTAPLLYNSFVKNT